MQEGPERIDYQETQDVTEVHAAVKREHGDPRANVTPIPMWLTALCGIAMVWAGAYIGVFHGGFRGDVFDENRSSPALLFPPTQKATAGAEAVQLSLVDLGKSVFNGNCQACHQSGGQGLPAMNYPPLASSEWVKGSEKRLVGIILKGLVGPVTVAGKTYNGVGMVPWEGSLTDKKIAGVATYIRASWGNGAPEISEAKVKAARAEFASRTTPFTEPDLLQIPADATLPDAAGSAAAAPAATGAPAPAVAAAPAPTAGAAPATAPPQGASPAAAAPGAAPPPTPAPAGQTPPPAPAPAAAAPAAASPQQMALGKAQYMMVCVACHQPTGLGLPPVFPPLVKSEYVNGSAARFAAMILKGNAGPMTIDGKLYNNIMPGQELMLTDDKIAAVMTFVRANFGNNAPPVSPEVVKAARAKFADRKTPWTEPELKAWKD
jgi:mono/diheme cytochrome c family protein